MRSIIAILSLLFFASCDPDVAGEKITLSPVTFAFKISNDTPYLRVGDTLNIRAAISSTVDSIRLTDGEGIIAAGISRGDNIPQTSFGDNWPAKEGIDCHFIINRGGVKRTNGDTPYIIRFTGNPVGDSIIMDYSLVFLKPGLYYLGGFQSSFYEGSKGKGRWDAYFDVSNPHWDEFWQVNGHPALQPGDPAYKKAYWVAVTQ